MTANQGMLSGGEVSRRILVVTADALTERMAGPAIRAWQLARRLSDVGHDVQLVTINPVCSRYDDRFTVRSVSPDNMTELEAWSEVLVVQGYVLEGVSVLRDSEKVMIVDVYDPLHLETLELSRAQDEQSRRRRVSNDVSVLDRQLGRGDFFVCASEKQRDLWIGHLGALRRVNPATYDADPSLRGLIDVVPFGLPEEPPQVTRPALRGVVPGIAPDDDVILWGGGIYDWFDPLTLIRAMDGLRRRRPKARLVFMGMHHPNPEVGEMRMSLAARELAGHLGLTGSAVFFNEEWVPYQDRQNFLLEARVGVSTHLDHAEAAFSFRSRLLDYVWTGLPVVATSGDVLAELVEREGWGITVPPGDAEGLEDALYRMLSDDELASSCRERISQAADRYRWSKVLEPVVNFCRHAQPASDREPATATTEAPPPELGPSWKRELETLFGHLRNGGPRLVVGKAITRVGYRVQGPP